ncbi:MAG: 4Fe-4S ferredoxin [Desulfobacteraceae bacterium]|nr:4Fe-4S ferredoxin [Desulfobacteraceae bacterium]
MVVKRKIIKINEELCDGCGICVMDCAEGAIEIVDGRARLVSDNLCDGLGACMGTCPKNALEIIERDASEFDEKAVKDRLRNKNLSCQSLKMDVFESKGTLSNWPVQISLISCDSNVFDNSDLVVAADCVSASCPDFHRIIVGGRKLMIGCPKLDNIEEYIARLKVVFANNKLKSLTLARMDVPCCSKMESVLKESIKLSGKKIIFNTITVSRNGKIV